LERRAKALYAILAMERSTSKALAFSEWPSPPQVVIEEEDICSIFDRYKMSNST
jgi:glutaredoxin-related protein